MKREDEHFIYGDMSVCRKKEHRPQTGSTVDWKSKGTKRQDESLLGAKSISHLALQPHISYNAESSNSPETILGRVSSSWRVRSTADALLQQSTGGCFPWTLDGYCLCAQRLIPLHSRKHVAKNFEFFTSYAFEGNIENGSKCLKLGFFRYSTNAIRKQSPHLDGPSTISFACWL